MGHKLWEDSIIRISEHLSDDLSMTVFANRLLYNLTGDAGYLRNLVSTIPKGKAFLEMMENNRQKKAIFGAGQWGKWIYELLPHENWVCFIDNQPLKEEIYGLPVVCLEGFLDLFDDVFIVISSRFYYEEIKTQLRIAGIKEENICILVHYSEQVARSIYFDLPYLTHDANEFFIDAGGYNGETTNSFIKWCDNKFDGSMIFEPEVEFQSIIIEKYRNNDRIHIMPYGLWDKKATLSFEVNGSESRVTEKETSNSCSMVEVAPLDDICDHKVTFIKMDIEGAEQNALKGAKRIIKENRPKLAISIYHTPEDMWAIPEQILAIHDDYRLYLRHYSLSWFDTVLYAL